MRVLLYSDFPVALPYLDPLYKFLKSKDVDVHYTGDARSKLIIEERGESWVDGQNEYDWIICCDKLSACPVENRIVIFHGLASKGQDFCNRIGISERNVCPTDISFVFSDYYRDLYIRGDGAEPDKVIVAGLSKFDAIESIPPKNEIPKILYAPTHNRQLSAITTLGSSIYELDNLTVHLHNATLEDPQYGDMVALHPKHVDKTNMLDMILDADIVIADFGSAIIEAIALGKMAIQIQNRGQLGFYLERVGRHTSQIPEVRIPIESGYSASSVDEIREIIKLYPMHQPSTFPIVENIGYNKVSNIIYEWLIRNN